MINIKTISTSCLLGLTLFSLSGCGSSSSEPETNPINENPSTAQPTTNQKPSTENASISTTEDAPLAIHLTANDNDQDTLTYLYTTPTNGTLSGTAPSLTYTPNAGFFGSDSFTYHVNDGTLDSEEATISIMISSTNTAPILSSIPNTTKEQGVSISLTSSAQDADGDTLSYVWQEGTHILSTESSFSKDDFSVGEHNLTCTVSDPEGASNTETFIVQIRPSNDINDIPTASNSTITIDEDKQTPLTFLSNDLDGDTLSINILSQPAHGHIEGTAPNLRYIPDANFNGTDTITFKANDGFSDSNTASITININPVNDAPTLNAGEDITALYLSPVSLFAVANDIDSPSDSCVWKEANTILSTTHTLNKSDFPSGVHTLTATVSDNEGASTTDTVIVTITNQEPTADAKSVNTLAKTPVNITLSGTDTDGHDISYTLSTNPTNGTLTGTAPALIYTPNADFGGNDTFSYQTFDGDKYSNMATVSIQVNDNPTANAGTNTTIDLGTNITLTGTGSDSDGSIVSYRWDKEGVVLSNTASYTYTPTKMGKEPLTLTVTDNHGATASDTIMIGSKKTLPLVLIRVEFNNYTFNSDANTWSQKIYGTQAGQLNHYYNEISYGLFQFSKVQESAGTTNDGVITVKLNINHPGNDGFTAQHLANAINLANPYINFAQYNTNHDNAISKDELQVMFLIAGGEASTGLNPGVWAHEYCLHGQNGTAPAPTVDNVEVMGCFTNGNYSRFGESQFQIGRDATIGVIAHELGHAVFGLPDLYDTTGASEGIGNFGLMGSGSWGQTSWDEKPGSMPIHMTSWSKLYCDFTRAIQLDHDQTNVPIRAASYTDYQVYKILTGRDGEYFLLDNRVNSGYDRGLFLLQGATRFKGGLSILHIDEHVNDDYQYTNNDIVTHKRVDVEEANNAGLDDKTHRGDVKNLFYFGNANNFTPFTTPSSNRYDGQSSGFSINNISDIADTMHIDVEINQ